MLAEAVVIECKPVILNEQAQSGILVTRGIKHAVRARRPVDCRVQVPATSAYPSACLSGHRGHGRPVDVVPAARVRREVGRAGASKTGQTAADLRRLRTLPGTEQLDGPVVEWQHAVLACLPPPQLDQGREAVGLVFG